MLADDLTHGHVLLADWLFLIAAILFVIVAVLLFAKPPDRTRGVLLPIGLALLALGWMVL